MHRKKTFLLISLSLSSGLLLASAYSLRPIWWTAWLGAALLLVVVAFTPSSWRRFIAMLAGCVAGLFILPYHATIAGWPLAFGILVLRAMLWSSAVRLAASFIDRGNAFIASFSVPTAIAAAETLLVHFSPHGSVSSLAYSQMDIIPVIQLASLGGVPAVTFFVLFGASSLAVVFILFAGKRLPNPLPVTVITSLLIATGLVFGFHRASSPTGTDSTDVVLFSVDRPGPKPTDWNSFWDIYGEDITNAASSNSVIVLPEAILKLQNAEVATAANYMAELAKDRHATFVIGIVVDDVGKITNRALVSNWETGSAWYEKQYLIPGIEAGIAPGSIEFVTSKGLGIAICKDMHFPTLGRTYAAKGAKIILVPANDFKVDDWMMARVTAMRGVENGFMVARATRNGLSFASDPFGRILGEMRSTNTLTSLSLKVPNTLIHGTIYSSVGDLFGWLCGLFWLVLVFVNRKNRCELLSEN